MVSHESAARRRANARSARVISRYQNYVPSPNDDLGEFLSHFRRLWTDAHQYGVTGFDEIYRLIILLPLDWQSWAAEVAHRYIGYMDPQYDLVGNLLGFLGELHYTYIVYGQAPREAYAQPKDSLPVARTQVVDQHAKTKPLYPPTTIQIRPAKRVDEAGPSRRPKPPVVEPSSSSTSSDSDGSIDIATVNRRLGARREALRRGKAPIHPKLKKDSTPRATYVKTATQKPLRILDNQRPSQVRIRTSPPSEETSVGNIKRQKTEKGKRVASSSSSDEESSEKFPWADLTEPTLSLDVPLTFKRKKKHIKEISSKIKTERQQYEATGAQVLLRESSAAIVNIDSNSEKENSGKDLGCNKPDIDFTPPAPNQQ